MAECFPYLAAMGVALTGVASALWRILIWYRECEQKRIEQALEMAKLLGGISNEETKK
jgi:hypothetical protein